jgi:hypothetical protein
MPLRRIARLPGNGPPNPSSTSLGRVGEDRSTHEEYGGEWNWDSRDDRLPGSCIISVGF